MHLCLLEVNLGNASHTSLLLQNSYFSILKAQTYKIVPKIYTVMQVSLLALSELSNEAFLGKEWAPKIRQPKISPSVTDSMVSTSQTVSPHRTQSLHSAPQEPPTPPNCPRLLSHSSHAFCFASRASFHAPFVSFPKAAFCTPSCMKTISNVSAFHMFTFFLENFTTSTLSLKFWNTFLKYF